MPVVYVKVREADLIDQNAEAIIQALNHAPGVSELVADAVSTALTSLRQEMVLARKIHKQHELHQKVSTHGNEEEQR